jgi:Putative Actinobacterial Holin-X, holin superfamily III
MSHRDDSAGPSLPPRPAGSESPSAGQLVSQLSQELSTLVRDEMRLAQAEMTEKAKKVGVGAGMFGAAGLLALYACGVLIATAILVLALALDPWLAALIVGVVLLAAAGVAALLGRNRVQEAGSPVPIRAVESVKRDVDAVRHPADH